MLDWTNSQTVELTCRTRFTNIEMSTMRERVSTKRYLIYSEERGINAQVLSEDFS